MDAWLIGVIIYLAYMVSVVLIGTRVAIASWEAWDTATADQRTLRCWLLFPLHTLTRQVGKNYLTRLPSDFLPIVWWNGRYYGKSFSVLLANENAVFYYITMVSFSWPVKVAVNALTLSIIGVGYGVWCVVKLFIGIAKNFVL